MDNIFGEKPSITHNQVKFILPVGLYYLTIPVLIKKFSTPYSETLSKKNRLSDRLRSQRNGSLFYAHLNNQGFLSVVYNLT